jgi:hypothetical protein
MEAGARAVIRVRPSNGCVTSPYTVSAGRCAWLNRLGSFGDAISRGRWTVGGTPAFRHRLGRRCAPIPRRRVGLAGNCGSDASADRPWGPVLLAIQALASSAVSRAISGSEPPGRTCVDVVADRTARAPGQSPGDVVAVRCGSRFGRRHSPALPRWSRGRYQALRALAPCGMLGRQPRGGALDKPRVSRSPLSWTAGEGS